MSPEGEFLLGEWTVHPEQNRVTDGGESIHMSPRCMDVLVLLARRAGEVVSRDDFSEAIWSPSVVTDDALTRYISELRRVLGDDRANPKFIETIPKRGYRLIAPVKPGDAARPTAGRAATGNGQSVGGGVSRYPVRPVILGLIAIVLGLGALWMHWPQAPEAEPRPSVAVLPFETFGDEVGNPMVDGLHHDLLTRLSDIGDLRVISRTSVRQYKDSVQSIPEIAAALDVGWVVEGAFQMVGDRIQLNAQLIDARTDSHVWAKTYRRDLTAENLFAIQADLVENIAASLQARLTGAEQILVDNVPTGDLAAYTFHAQGRTYLETRTEEGMSQALVLFQNAVAQDPDFALAWVGLADALLLLHDFGYRPLEEVLPEAQTAIARAMELEPDLAEAHTSTGLLHSIQRNGPAALYSLKRATELRPGYAEAHNWLAWNYQVLGFPDKALVSARRAVDLNPASTEARSNLITSLLAHGRIEEALAQIDRLETMGLSYTEPFHSGLALYLAGRHEEAVEVLDGMSLVWTGGGPQSVLALAHIALGDHQAAEGVLEELVEMEDIFSSAMVLAALDRTRAAFDTLAELDEWGYWPALAMNLYADELLENLVDDPEFQSLMAGLHRHYGLTAEQETPDPDLLSRQ